MKRVGALALLLVGFAFAEAVAFAVSAAIENALDGDDLRRWTARVRKAHADAVARPTPTEVHDVVAGARRITGEAARAADERG